MIAQESGLTMTHTIWEKYSTNWSYAICLWIVIRIGYPPQEHLSPFPASIFRATESLSPGSWFCFSLLACLFKSHFKFIQLWACEPTSNQDTMVRFIVLHCSVSSHQNAASWQLHYSKAPSLLKGFPMKIFEIIHLVLCLARYLQYMHDDLNLIASTNVKELGTSHVHVIPDLEAFWSMTAS